MKNKEIFRVSYSILSAWASGDYDTALKMYHRIEMEPNEYQIDGKRWHKKWEAETKKTGCMPKVFGGKKLENPITELKIEKDLNEWLQLVGVIDLVDDGKDCFGVDYKTGSIDSSQYSNGWQHSVYQILFPRMKRFEFHHYNQHKKIVDMSIVHLTDKTLVDGLEWIITQASDMKNYIDNNDLTFEQGGN